eukprot:COSAG02_NODE_8920_length_2400_cov_1.365928_5_plen_41_part_00
MQGKRIVRTVREGEMLIFMGSRHAHVAVAFLPGDDTVLRD